MGKGEIAYYEQFLLFPKCFQKAWFPGASKGVIVWEWVKWNKIDLAKLLSAIFHSHFQGKKRSRKLLIFNDHSKKSNDRIIVCILIKTKNLYDLILAVVPLCYEFYSLYSANSDSCYSLLAHWAAILDFIYILVLCICGNDRGTSEEFDTVSLAKKSIISRGWGSIW